MLDFPQRTCAFLQDLKDNNDRNWFQANKNRYEDEWLDPATAFVSAISAQMGTLAPPHKAVPKVNGSIRRLHRDTRFSKDKTPFDPKLHLVFWTGEHPNRSPAIHLVLHPDRLGFGAGLFAMVSEELDRFRACLASNDSRATKLTEVLNLLHDQGCALTAETLKRIPQGIAVSPNLETLVKRKGLVARTPDTMLAPETICDQQRMGRFFDAAAQLNHWLAENVALQ
ncbi:MAG: DUF2461 domain-containing protein [Pseudomonadota bacterium]